jgi:3-oxoacyl-[acyl-carrier-protein] synthase II
MRRVVITGIGAVTPLGSLFQYAWKQVKAGVTGLAAMTRFDAGDMPWKIAGEVKGFIAEQYLSAKEMRRLDPFVHYAVAAATEAFKDAGLSSTLPPSASYMEFSGRSGVVIGSGRGGISYIEKALLRTEQARVSPYLMPSSTICMAASFVARKLGINGHCLGISNACASGTNAVGEAFRLIRHGYSDMVLAGGTEAPLCRLCVEGYGVSGALSISAGPGASRPFDIDRDGFILSEGACVLVLEEYESAVKRNADIYAEIAGYGNTTDAFHITRPDMKGEAAAILAAMKDAGLEASDVDYVNAHGTSTQIGDKTEAAAIREILGSRVPVGSIKSMTGHMLAASGAFETACTAMSLKEGVIPPTINLKQKDPECDINVITTKTEADIKTAICSSFGFGGVNAVLALRRAY